MSDGTGARVTFDVIKKSPATRGNKGSKLQT